MPHTRLTSALAALLGLSLSACSPTAHSSPPPQNSGVSGADHRLTVVPPRPISLGILPPGRAASARLTLKNGSAEAITLDRVETSCPCIRVAPLPGRVEPGSERSLTVSFDPAEEPAFRGGLSVELVGIQDPGIALFERRVTLEVRSLPVTIAEPQARSLP